MRSLSLDDIRVDYAEIQPRESQKHTQVVTKPVCASQREWAMMCKAPFWRGMRVAHIASDGWHTPTFRRKYQCAGACPDEIWVFYCKDTKLEYAHRLLIEDCGLARAWVVVGKASGDDDEPETCERQYVRARGAPRARWEA